MSEKRDGMDFNFLVYMLIVITPLSILLKNTLISISWLESFPSRQIIQFLPYFLLLHIGYYLLRNFMACIQKPSLPFTQKLQLTSATIVLLLCVIFFNRIEILQELIFYSTHRDAFVDLVDAGKESGCYVSGSSCIEYMELSDTLELASGRERIFILSSFQKNHLIATRSRANIYYVYVPETTPVPEGEKIYQQNVHCFYQLGDGWYLCRM